MPKIRVEVPEKCSIFQDMNSDCFLYKAQWRRGELTHKCLKFGKLKLTNSQWIERHPDCIEATVEEGNE